MVQNVNVHWLITLKRWLGGKISRVRVSAYEYWDLAYFIDHYLEYRRFERTERNRQLLREITNAYPGGNPPRREDLVRYLDLVCHLADNER